jgi:DNA-directed RNA polymerase subunit N
MIIPIRCMTCGKPVAHLWEEYNKRTQSGEDKKTVLDDLQLLKYCCRTLFLTHVDSYKDVAKFKR